MSVEPVSVADIVEGVSQSVERVVNKADLKSWMAKEKSKAGDLVAINNSFLFRGTGTTVKSDKCLAFTVGDESALVLPPVVAVVSNFISQFKRYPGKQASMVGTTDLVTAVNHQIGVLGPVVLALIGEIGPDEPADANLGAGEWSVLAFEPSQTEVAVVEEGRISINRLDDIDVVWAAVAVLVGEHRTAVEDKFEPAFQTLQRKANRSVDVSAFGSGGPSILSKIIERIADQVAQYEEGLTQHRANADDAEALHELLRVAYNFADGAATFINLVVGLCDLKPILFWLTVAEQIELADAFAQLPFAIVGKGKPSLDKYQHLIADARNQAFHDMFAFDRSFRVQMPGAALGQVELRLFRDYGRRSEPALDFEDRKLVELLEGFTRVQVRPVPLGFWDANLAVMKAVHHLAERLQAALTQLAELPATR